MGIQSIDKNVQFKPRRAGIHENDSYVKPKPGQEIVITGISGKFPDSEDVYQFRNNLFNKVDLISDDHRRWKPTHPEIPQRSGKLYNIDKFDNGFFGIPKLQSDNMDPMIRMVLEKVYETIIDAGYHPSDLENTNTGVFIGECFSETEGRSFFKSQVRNADAFACVEKSMAAKRINHFYKLNGPAYVSDSACSSSMYALEQAYVHLNRGLCDRAIVCGIQVGLLPGTTLQFSRLGVLSADGRSKTFDNAADGYVRSEAIVTILLEKAADAKRVYAEILHTKTNCDGFKEQGISFPSADGQKTLMKEVYEEIKIDPSTLSFVEAHGTGTTVGDEVELKTIDDIFCTGRTKPLLIGSVKSNMGHSEAAAGLCSIAKVLIAMEAGYIPPNINYNEPRKGVAALEDGRMVVVTEKMPWAEENVLVGINSFGFGGANAHVLLKWHSNVKRNNGEPTDNLPRLICISGRTNFAVESIIDDVASRTLDAEYVKLIHQVYRKSISNHFFRGYSIIAKDNEIKREITKFTTTQKKLCLVFTNFDKQWFHLGKDLLTIPIFNDAMERIDSVLQQKLDMSPILNSSNNGNSINQVLGTISVQLAIAQVLKELNVKVDMMIGIGFGELLCAYLDNILTLEEVILSAFYIATDLEKKSIENGNKTLKEILSKKAHKAMRWVPIYHNNQNEFVHAFGSVDYIINNILTPIPLADYQKYASPDHLSLIIGNNEKYTKENCTVLLDVHTKNPIVNFLDSLGKIYLKGIDMELDNLYPKISFPVSRGTPMLSPLVKWDHTQNWKVVSVSGNITEKETVHVVVHVDPKMGDWRFVTGHIIDGRNLFPATGYLTLVWEFFALAKGISQEWCQMSVVFEDVRFRRAANVPADGALDLEVTVQLNSQYFEVTENGTLLVSGKVYELPQNHESAILAPETLDEGGMILESKDVYKELKLRGYQYIDQFRAIKRSNMSGTNAIISWSGNWITFMDNMLQCQILQEDTRNLYVPTSIKKLIIDGPKHVEYANKYQNEIPVVCHNTLSLLSGGGIEIHGLGASSIPKRKIIAPVLETYKFIPYECELPEQDAVRTLVQIILENSNALKVKAVEIYSEKMFMALVEQTLADLPLIQPELVVLSNKELDMHGIRVEDGELSMHSGCLLVMGADILNNNELLTSALKAVRDSSGFIISYQATNSIGATPTNIETIASYDIQCGTLILLQEVKHSREHSRMHQPMEINPSLESLPWIEPLKTMIKTNQKIVLYAQKSKEPHGLLGLVNCLRKEINGSNISTVILMDEAPLFDINNEFYKKQLDKNVAINVWKNGQWGSFRHLRMPQIQFIEREHCFANVTTRGDLSSLSWIEGALTKMSVVTPTTEIVDIYYAALNFRDVMIASGKLQVDAITKDRVLQECIQGFEFSGRDASGRRVMGMTPGGSLATMTLADKHLLWPVPDKWSLEDAATIPVVYGTVIFALLIKGGIKKGQTILIHSGTGGVGQAAINIAIHHGCDIFTTVGTPEKKAFIRKHFPQIKEEHIGDSRSTSFEQMVLKYTKGRGVDYVLNSLAEEKLQASVRCLAPKGIFLEIGKFDFANDNPIAVSLLKRQATFVGVMLDHAFNSNEMKKVLGRELSEGFRSTAVKPLIRTTFKYDEVEPAFRYMTTGKHMGKVLIKIRNEEETASPLRCPRTLFKALPRFSCNPDYTYIILGGLGGFGLELADWLVIRGARKLVLTSRSGVKNGYQSYRLNIFKPYGAKVIIRNDDVASPKGCQDLLKAANAMGPVDGIFNLAVVLQDALFENQTEEDFRTSLGPKAIATRNLDTISRVVCPNLRYFVVFSSVSCGRGNAGQTNYGMANSVMERICEARKSAGYPALAVQWGAIGDVGLVAEMQENNKELVIGGTLQQKISNCLQLMDYFLSQGETVVASMVVAEKKYGAGANNIVEAVLNILGINLASVSIHSSLPELGMDSMMAVEIKQTLEREYEVFLTAQDIRGLTIVKLKEMTSKSGEVEPTKPQDEDKNILPEDMQLLLRYIADEKTANIPSIRMDTGLGYNENAPIVFGLAGIEGMAAVFEPIAKHMKFHFTCLQFCTGYQAESIEDLAKPLVKSIESTPGNFSIIAYSFGCIVATEVMQLLEMSGKFGKAIFIDGAPDMLTKLVKTYFPEESDEVFETSLLCVIMTRFMPFDEILKHKYDIMKQKTYEEKIRYVMKISPKMNHSESYLIEMAKSARNRIKSLRKYQTKAITLKSPITLVKPTKQSIVDIEDDYNLSSICQKEVNVHVLEGNHVTVLENEALRKIIDEFIETDDCYGKIPNVSLNNGEIIGIKCI